MEELGRAAVIAAENNDVRMLERLLDKGADNIFEITQMARICNSYRVLNYMHTRYPELEQGLQWI